MIHIIVFIPEIRLRREMIVNPNIKVQTIKTYLPNSNCNLVSRGEVLSGEDDLASISIGNGDILIAYTQKSAVNSRKADFDIHQISEISQHFNGPHCSQNYSSFYEDESIWRRITEDDERFKEKVSKSKDPQTMKARARIRDLKMTQIERNPRFNRIRNEFYRTMMQLGCGQNGDSYFKATKLDLQYLPSSQPSIDPLPVLW
ncbi:hypothetical protein TRFO_36819 [Tritrichomonas foetus]|uniref:Ubiquitin-like domain-containing protein n=1 Tax=Tritrichomonas foetus TaxID=1144522 RepID=A0A1J4JFF0_9EUKA|nr:hypothetical protein TRFO_36819 [Tritrichomonas foetus]|eukprot:OHS97015.1 hypothetical protein TRFO_36819 [Tritrichomonas foetus]